MNKEIKKLLAGCNISAKWFNINQWKKEDFTNLLELVEHEQIKIKKRKIDGTAEGYTITYAYGRQTVKLLSTWATIENDIVCLYVQRCVYLGDKFKVSHRLRDYKNY